MNKNLNIKLLFREQKLKEYIIEWAWKNISKNNVKKREGKVYTATCFTLPHGTVYFDANNYVYFWLLKLSDHSGTIILFALWFVFSIIY